MKILFLIISLPHLSKSCLYSDLIREFKAHGHDVKVATPTPNVDDVGLHDEVGISVLRFKSDQVVGNSSMVKKGIGYMKLMYQYPKAVKKHFGKESFDLIYANSLPWEIGFVAKSLKKHFKSKFYLMVCDYTWQNLVSLGIFSRKHPIVQYYKYMEEVAFKNADYIGGLSQAYIDTAAKYHPFVADKPTQVILPSGEPIQIGGIDKEEVKKDFDLQGKFVAIYGGNVSIAQKIENVISVAEQCADYHDLVFAIVGKGSQIDKIKQDVKNKGINNIKFIDFMPKNKYLQLLSACDIGLISLNEKLGAPSFPSKSTSLFNLSIPVVASIDAASDYGDYLEKYNCGLWSLSGDMCKFKDNILTLYNNRYLCVEMGDNAKKLYNSEMTINSAYNKMVEIINQQI